MLNKLFTELAGAEKVEFFVQCQRLLVAYHPDSPFVIRKTNFKERAEHMKTLLANYKGMVYQDDNVCILYNYLIVTDPKEPELSVRNQMYRPPAEHYNSIIIDFVVFREIRDCLTFVQAKSETKLQHVLFARHNKIKVYPVIELLSNIFKVPVVG